MIRPTWSAPPNVQAMTTTRAQGVSAGPYESLNLATRVGDNADLVRQNRQALVQRQGWTSQPLWLNQVHGTNVVQADETSGAAGILEADGAITRCVGLPLVVLTADCLPVVATDQSGTVIGAFHAGWKGLLAGVLEKGLEAMACPFHTLMVWIGPSIAQASYQVGPDVREAYLAHDAEHRADFVPDGDQHWRFDLPGAALRRLRHRGVGSVTLSGWDTFANPDLFFSHRRSAPCGRMATLITLLPGKVS